MLRGYYAAWEQPAGLLPGRSCAHPAAVYIAGTREQCEAFALGIRCLDDVANIVVLSSVVDLRDSNPPPLISGSILSVTPIGLLGCLGIGIVSLSCAAVLVFDEANAMVTGKVCDHVTQIQDLLRKQQGLVKTPQLFIASHFTKIQMDKMIINRERLFGGNFGNVKLEIAPDPSILLALSFAVVDAKIASKLTQLQQFVMRSMRDKKRALIVFTLDHADVKALQVSMGFWPEVQLYAVDHDTSKEIDPRAAAALTSGKCNVLLVKLAKSNSHFSAPSLNDCPTELNVCIFRMYKEHGQRSWFEKYRDLVARVESIDKVKECLTVLDREEFRAGHANRIRRWLEETGKDVPRCLYPKLTAADGKQVAVGSYLAGVHYR